MEYEIAYQTKKGDKPINEDKIFILQEENRCICLLADGLGGLGAGEVASSFVVSYITDALRKLEHLEVEAIKKIIVDAHEALMIEKENNTYGSKMCTTLVLLAIEEKHAFYAHVGDSRLYIFKDGKASRMTSDHSVCRFLVNSGELELEKIRFHEDKNKLTKAMGQREGFGLVMRDMDIEPEHDLFFLCSDGVWENLYTEELELTYCKSRNLQMWLDEIEVMILLNGKENMDNYSMIAVMGHEEEVEDNE